MAWKTLSLNERKTQFVNEALIGEVSFSELCRRFEISRPTGYIWIGRYREEGIEGLKERSRAARNHPNAIRPQVEQWILEARVLHPTWGPKKLVRWVEKKQRVERLCALSTAGEILRRHGLSVTRKVTRRSVKQEGGLSACDGPNRVWCVDFKGYFRLGNGDRCDPLTLTDGFSRYLLRCQALHGTKGSDVKRILDSAFREYGLPDKIRSDNGAPFARPSAGGLSTLSVWWIKLGIEPERIAPGKPQQNGRHERMHRTLKSETTNPPEENLRRQQKRFDAFKKCFNFERPHEALAQETPASAYECSARRYTGRVREPEYEESEQKRKVQQRGEFYWASTPVFLSEAVAGETVALKQKEGGLWEVRFAHVKLGIFDENARKMTFENVSHPRQRK
jgi:transposase InsO family protein